MSRRRTGVALGAPGWIGLVGLVGVFGLAAATGPAAAATLSYLEQDRGVFSEALATSSGASDGAVDPDEASGFANYDAATQASGSTATADADADAALRGNLLPQAIGARAGASAAASTGASDGRGHAPGDAFFEVVFEVDASESWWLDGEVAASGSGAGADAHAVVELVDLDGGTSLVLQEAAPGGSASFSETGTLQPGVRYRLTAFALARARADDTATSGQGDASAEALFYVPEPSPALQRAVGAAGLLVLARLRGRSGRRAAAAEAS